MSTPTIEHGKTAEYISSWFASVGLQAHFRLEKEFIQRQFGKELPLALEVLTGPGAIFMYVGMNMRNSSPQAIYSGAFSGGADLPYLATQDQMRLDDPLNRRPFILEQYRVGFENILGFQTQTAIRMGRPDPIPGLESFQLPPQKKGWNWLGPKPNPNIKPSNWILWVNAQSSGSGLTCDRKGVLELNFSQTGKEQWWRLINRTDFHNLRINEPESAASQCVYFTADNAA